MLEKLVDLVQSIISDAKRLLAFCILAATLVGLLLLVVWQVPRILHVSTSKLTISSKGSEIELKASTPDQDQYYLIVSPQATWQPSHIYIKKGTKLGIVADGRVNVDFHGLYDQIERRIALETKIENSHNGLRADPDHTPEEYFSRQDWESLVPRHYWTGPEGDAIIAPTSFKGRQKYKIAPEISFGALVGTFMSREDVDSNGQPPNESHDVFSVGRQWPDPTKQETAPVTGWLWLAVNDVVEPESAFPSAKGIRVSDFFLLDNLGTYRVVVTVPR